MYTHQTLSILTKLVRSVDLLVSITFTLRIEHPPCGLTGPDWRLTLSALSGTKTSAINSKTHFYFNNVKTSTQTASEQLLLGCTNLIIPPSLVQPWPDEKTFLPPIHVYILYTFSIALGLSSVQFWFEQLVSSSLRSHCPGKISSL